jgi:hypothetical protein
MVERLKTIPATGPAFGPRQCGSLNFHASDHRQEAAMSMLVAVGSDLRLSVVAA